MKLVNCVGKKSQEREKVNSVNAEPLITPENFSHFSYHYMTSGSQQPRLGMMFLLLVPKKVLPFLALQSHVLAWDSFPPDL